MATGDKNDLLIQIANELPDNNTGDINPSNIRTTESAMVTYNVNMEELTEQVVKGPIEFDTTPTSEGLSLITEAPLTGFYYVRNNGQWVRKASLLATSNAVIPINNNPASPSFLTIDDASQSVGITLTDGATGTVRNDTGRVIEEMTGSISMYPEIGGGTLRRIVVVSEESVDNITWTGNLNSIRKIEVGSTSETFKTTISLYDNWPVGGYLRFRVYDEADGGLDLVPAAATILGQPFTGPSMIWSLLEN